MFRKVNKFLSGNGRGRGTAAQERESSDQSSSDTSSSASFQRKVEQLESMGFDKIQCENALEATNGDLEQATHHLLANQSVLDQEPQLQNNNQDSNNTSSTNRHRSAAAVRAGQAAASRAQPKPNTRKNKPTKPNTKNNTSTNTNSTKKKLNQHQPYKASHPNVQMPPALSSKTKQEQILRCTNRLAPHPLAVDTLLRAFTCIRTDPDADKYRKIDPRSEGFQRVLEGVPGALDLILAMNFVERGGGGTGGGGRGRGTAKATDLVLIRERVDPALLFLGISALEKTRESKEYAEKKKQIAFEKDAEDILQGNRSRGSQEETTELIQRAECLSKVPSEPLNGAGALMQVIVGKETKLSRRFDGDDTLQDVVHWMGAHGSAIPDKILSREWSLVDLNRYPLVAVDVECNLDRTLQYIGCWPSGRMEIRASSDEWREGKVTGEDMGSSRGLGSAPSSVVN
jgi:hypothetical protein